MKNLNIAKYFLKKHSHRIPLFTSHIIAGFPSPAESYVENNLNLHEHLVHKPASTFFVRVAGDSMIGAGIFKGDLLIVDRSIEPRHRSIIVAVVFGEFTLKRFIKRQDKIFLQPENPKYHEIEITDESQFEVWGVATANVHDLRNI